MAPIFLDFRIAGTTEIIRSADWKNEREHQLEISASQSWSAVLFILFQLLPPLSPTSHLPPPLPTFLPHFPPSSPTSHLPPVIWLRKHDTPWLLSVSNVRKNKQMGQRNSPEKLKRGQKEKVNIIRVVNNEKICQMVKRAWQGITFVIYLEFCSGT